MVKKTGGALLLSLQIDPAAETALSTQVLIGLRELILSGGLRPGERLPATRTIARDLGISRTTVVEAFARLADEGLVTCRTGAGTYVSDALRAYAAAPARPADNARSEIGPAPRLSRIIAHGSEAFFERLPHVARAFTTALPAFDAFPMALWARHVAKHWRDRRDVVMGYGDVQGLAALRRAIAAHLRANRGISCDAGQVFIVNGAQQAFQLISGMLLDPGDRVWFENPGAIGARNCFAAGGARLIPVPVDEEGLVVEQGLTREPDFRLAFVTPSHQQPLGSTMSLRRRLALLAAAGRADAWIVEDDYDGDFRYAGSPPSTLQSIDNAGRVIYVGTFSKTLFPALRLGFFLAPQRLVDTFARFMGAFFPGVPSNPQGVVADFIDEGHFAAHIRRMRKLYAERYEALRDAATTRIGGVIDIAPTSTGLHTVGYLAPTLSESEVARAAHARNLTVAGIGRYCIRPVDRQGLVLGFSGVKPEEIAKGVAVLGEILEAQARERTERPGQIRPPKMARAEMAGAKE